jgi:hypothetical protein
MENNLYAQQYTQTMEFLLQLLKNDLENVDSLTLQNGGQASTHEDKINRLPTYISMLHTIEQMR